MNTKFNINWKKTMVVVFDIAVAAYLIMAVSSWNTPGTLNGPSAADTCSKVSITIADIDTDGFLSADEVKQMLQQKKIYPFKQAMADIDVRKMEDVLKDSPFIEDAECYKTQDGHVCINLQQRMPIMRIKSETGADYYVDNRGGVLPNTKYVANLIICTGNIPQRFAQKTLYRIANYICHDDFWRNQVVQLNVLDDYTIELVPRVGDHIAYLGSASEIEDKLERLRKFYVYGLNQAGWNKYKYISVEFSNQIICKKHKTI